MPITFKELRKKHNKLNTPAGFSERRDELIETLKSYLEYARELETDSELGAATAGLSEFLDEIHPVSLPTKPNRVQRYIEAARSSEFPARKVMGRDELISSSNGRRKPQIGV